MLFHHHNDAVAVLVLSLVLFLTSFGSCRFVAAGSVPHDEVRVLEMVVRRLGVGYWKFNGDSCSVEAIGLTVSTPPPRDSKANITCYCGFQNDTCHIIAIDIKRFNLPGILPPEVARLPYIRNM